jgi:Ser/Thr protein kinase RdoA (MazF antagonist)
VRCPYDIAMAVPLRCVDSTVAPIALLDAMRLVYAVEEPATCELIQRHLDATYLVTGTNERRIARLYNARWWSREEVEGEIAVLRHLEARGVRVAAPVKRTDGAWLTALDAPEGERQLVVYEYLDGEGLLPSRDAGRFGELVGRMHRALADCVLVQRRRELTFRGLTQDTFDAILPQLGEQNEHRIYLEDLRARVLTRATDLGSRDFREGLCHGDLNFSNAVRQPDGEIGLYDFESCGKGMLAYDLAVFRWTQQLTGAPDQTWHDFIDGYRRCNELPERELAGMDLLVLLRQLYMLAHDARRTQIGSLGGRWRRARRTPGLDALRRLDAQLFGTTTVQGW